MIGKTLRPLLALCALTAAMPASAQYFIEDFETRTGGNGTVLFRQPSFSGTTDQFLVLPNPNIAQVLTEKALSGTKALKVNWQWQPVTTSTWLRLTTNNVATLGNLAIPVTNGYVEFRMFLAGPAPLAVTLGVRESNTTADLGGNGGATGGIEWVGATALGGTGDDSAPLGKTLTVGSWQTIGFFVDTEPVFAFAGASANGILETTSGKAAMENLAFRALDTAQRGPYTLYIDDIFMGFNVKSLTGNLILEDSPAPQVVPMEFRPTNAGPSFVRNVVPDANGDYNVKVPPGTYNVGIKHPKFLRKVVLNVDLSAGNAVLPAVTLLGGDANNDNAIDVFDLDVLVQGFNFCLGDEGYDARADFNFDDCVDIFDLDVLVRNFNETGDDFPVGD